MADFLVDNESVWRYLHILSGITWIGLLYFFNLVNLPLLKFDLKKPYDVDMAEKTSANITLKTLFWFRWGAMATLVFGLVLIEVMRRTHGDSLSAYFGLDGGTNIAGNLILMGVVLAIIMWFNVWFIIWPNQQVILSNNKRIAAGAADDEKSRLTSENAPLVKKAVMASRFNTWASVPMLFGMVFGAHGHPASDWGGMMFPLAVLAAVLIIMVAMSTKKD